jgi:hypothetical protein
MDTTVTNPLWLYYLFGVVTFSSMVCTAIVLPDLRAFFLGAPAADLSAVVEAEKSKGAAKKSPGAKPKKEAAPAPAPGRAGLKFLVAGLLWVAFFALLVRLQAGRGDIGFDVSAAGPPPRLGSHRASRAPARTQPHAILGIKSGASSAEIKSVYRTLSRVYHPDRLLGLSAKEKVESEAKFKMVGKAYEALTKEDSMKNFAEFGHPDGPRAFEFDLGLPEFFKQKENETLILAMYALLFGGLFLAFAQLAKTLQ